MFCLVGLGIKEFRETKTSDSGLNYGVYLLLMFVVFMLWAMEGFSKPLLS